MGQFWMSLHSNFFLQCCWVVHIAVLTRCCWVRMAAVVVSARYCGKRIAGGYMLLLWTVECFPFVIFPFVNGKGGKTFHSQQCWWPAPSSAILCGARCFVASKYSTSCCWVQSRAMHAPLFFRGNVDIRPQIPSTLVLSFEVDNYGPCGVFFGSVVVPDTLLQSIHCGMAGIETNSLNRTAPI